MSIQWSARPIWKGNFAWAGDDKKGPAVQRWKTGGGAGRGSCQHRGLRGGNSSFQQFLRELVSAEAP